jgi:membrane fusion protein, multidrug efflux system
MDGAEAPKKRSKKKRALVIFGLAAVAGLVALFFYSLYLKAHISTDDAYVAGTVYTVSSKVPGTVLKVNVADNRLVHKGDVILELEPDTYEKTVKETASSAEAEKMRIDELKATVSAEEKKVLAAEATLKRTVDEKAVIVAAVRSRKADVDSRKALFTQAGIDFQRAQELIKGGYVTQENFDRAKTNYETADASLKAAQEALIQAEVSVKTHESVEAETRAMLNAQRAALDQARSSVNTQAAQVRARQAQAELAGLRLSYTRVYAPGDGYVTRKNVEPGNIIDAGQPLMALVAEKDIYILANFKETQVHNIKPGQGVDIRVDTYPGRVFHGHVDSIMAGTGAAFSLFPPENATGNFVKVVQRIPVKIALDAASDSNFLRIGMSVTPTVHVK